MSVGVHLYPESIEALADALAQRLAELLRDSQAPAGVPVLIDAAEVARKFSLTRSWVYDHAAELGAVRLGGGPRGRLRFDPAKVAEVLSACSDGRGSQSADPRTATPKAPRRPRRSTGAERDLLPIRPPGGGRS